MPERPKAKETDTEDSDAGNAGSGGLKPEECRNRNHQAGCGKDMADTKKKKKRTSPFLIILLLIALGTFFYSGYKLLTIHLAYKAGVDEYNSIEEAYTVSPAEAEDGTEDDLTGEEKDILKKKYYTYCRRHGLLLSTWVYRQTKKDENTLGRHLEQYQPATLTVDGPMFED